MHVTCLLLGAAWFQYRNKERTMPVEAITFNHRQTAFYRAFDQHPEAVAVFKTKSRGLRQMRMLAHDAPIYVVIRLCKVHNEYHGGSGSTFWDYLDLGLVLEANFRVKSKGRSSHTP